MRTHPNHLLVDHAASIATESATPPSSAAPHNGPCVGSMRTGMARSQNKRGPGSWRYCPEPPAAVEARPTSGGWSVRTWWERMAMAASSPVATQPLERTTIKGTATTSHTATWLAIRSTIGTPTYQRRPSPPLATATCFHLPIGDIADGGQSVDTDLMEVGGLGDKRGIDGHAQEHQGQCWEKSARSPRPEVLQGHPAGGVGLGQEKRSDQVAGKHEEKVDSQIAAFQVAPREEEDSPDGNASKTVEPGEVAEVGAALCRHDGDGNNPGAVSSVVESTIPGRAPGGGGPASFSTGSSSFDCHLLRVVPRSKAFDFEPITGSLLAAIWPHRERSQRL